VQGTHIKKRKSQASPSVQQSRLQQRSWLAQQVPAGSMSSSRQHTPPQHVSLPAQDAPSVAHVAHRPSRQTMFIGQIPQSIVPPHPSGIGPQVLLCASQVVGVHDGLPQTFATPPPPQVCSAVQQAPWQKRSGSAPHCRQMPLPFVAAFRHVTCWFRCARKTCRQKLRQVQISGWLAANARHFWRPRLSLRKIRWHKGAHPFCTTSPCDPRRVRLVLRR